MWEKESRALTALPSAPLSFEKCSAAGIINSETPYTAVDCKDWLSYATVEEAQRFPCDHSFFLCPHKRPVTM